MLEVLQTVGSVIEKINSLQLYVGWFVVFVVVKTYRGGSERLVLHEDSDSKLYIGVLDLLCSDHKISCILCMRFAGHRLKACKHSTALQPGRGRQKTLIFLHESTYHRIMALNVTKIMTHPWMAEQDAFIKIPYYVAKYNRGGLFGD